MTFLDYIQEAGVRTSTTGKHSTAGWHNFVCPFCGTSGSQTNLGMGYNIRGNYVHCWKCGHHNLPATLAALTGRSLTECRKLVPALDRVPGSGRGTVRPGKLVLPAGVGPLRGIHRKYLRDERGLNLDDLERYWHFQGIGLAPRLSWTIFIPIYLDGEVVSWTTRAIGDTGVRYWSAKPAEEKVHHKDLLFGEDLVRNNIIIFEGPLDAERVG